MEVRGHRYGGKVIGVLEMSGNYRDLSFKNGIELHSACLRYMASMLSHWQAVIRANGGHKRY